MTTLSFPSYFSNLTLQPDSDSDPDSLSQPQSDNTTTETCPTPGSGMTRDTALHHVSFNQDHTCFTVGTTQGFRVYDCDPVKEMFRRDIDDTPGGIGFVEMLFRSQILAIVSRGSHAPPTKVLMWDDHSSRCYGELSFRSDVKSVRLRQDRIVVVLAHKVFVYDYVSFKLLHQIETAPNPSGLCEVSQGVGPNMVLVCPGLQTGQVRVDHYVSKRTRFIHAHDSKLACLGLTQDGRFLATASSRGTLVRVFNAFDGSLIQEVI